MHSQAHQDKQHEYLFHMLSVVLCSASDLHSSDPGGSIILHGAQTAQVTGTKMCVRVCVRMSACVCAMQWET